ncbi:MAG: LysR substrate-binding domain-containing protein [Eubacteriales bacterium]|nr:LysR substrate-binding domain-containing protein [Eubacteriales bacterium]
MRDMLLLAPLAMIFILGWFIVKKVDYFLENNQEIQPQDVGRRLRIGFSDPLAAESISDILEKYSAKYPDIPVSLFYGTEEELVRKLSADKLDIIFLAEYGKLPSDKEVADKEITDRKA